MLQDLHLYVISAEGPLFAQVASLRAAIEGGADIVQLRNKTASVGQLVPAARELVAFARPRGVPVIINDHVEVAIDADAYGVHLGQDDGSISAARARLKTGRLIGRSTHSLDQALAAVQDGADYLGVGPIFATPTKPGRAATGLDLLGEIAAQVRRPWFAIGGIDVDNIDDVISAGARRVAVVRAVTAAPDPAAAAATLKARLTAAATAMPA